MPETETRVEVATHHWHQALTQSGLCWLPLWLFWLYSWFLEGLVLLWNTQQQVLVQFSLKEQGSGTNLSCDGACTNLEPFEIAWKFPDVDWYQCGTVVAQSSQTSSLPYIAYSFRLVICSSYSSNEQLESWFAHYALANVKHTELNLQITDGWFEPHMSDRIMTQRRGLRLVCLGRHSCTLLSILIIFDDSTQCLHHLAIVSITWSVGGFVVAACCGQVVDWLLSVHIICNDRCGSKHHWCLLNSCRWCGGSGTTIPTYNMHGSPASATQRLDGNHEDVPPHIGVQFAQVSRIV